MTKPAPRSKRTAKAVRKSAAKPAAKPAVARAHAARKPRSMATAKPLAAPAAKLGWRARLVRLWKQEPETVWFGVLFVVAAVLRFWRPDWYVDRQFHPDERWIFGVVSQLSYPSEPQGLQYGTFPLYLLAMIKDLVSMAGGLFGHFDVNRFVIWSGRMLSGVFDLGTLVFTYLLGRRVWSGVLGRQLGLLAAAFLGFSVLNIQMAHFFVVDVPLGFLAAGCLYWSVGIAQRGRREDYLWAGIFIGLAMATKTSALPLTAAVGAAHLLGLSQASKADQRLRWRDLGLAVAVSLAAFFFAMPHAILDWTKFWSNQNEQSRILVSGIADVPYNRQYLHTAPYVYYFKNLIRYTLGWPFGLLAVAAFLGYPLGWVWRSSRIAASTGFQAVLGWWQGHAAAIVVWSFGLVYFAIVGLSFAKFNRYMLPLAPVFSLGAAMLALQLRERVKQARGRQLVNVGIGAALAGTMLWALAFVSIYGQEHPWIAASRWMLKHVPAVTLEGNLPRPTAVLNEEWGDDLPVHVKDVPSLAYQINKFPVQEPDTPRKREMILGMLQSNDVIVMADTRAHAVYRRLADRYPINAAYYELMFEEKLGYALAADFKNYPALLGVAFPDDAADESFTLYDHPHVYLFQRQSPGLAPEEQARRLDARIAEIQNRRSAQSRPAARAPATVKPGAPAAVATPLPTVVNANIGQPQGRPLFVLGALNSFTAGLAWIVLLEVIGLFAIPLCLSLFPRLPDSGIALAKIVGTLVFTWVVWALVSAGAMPHLQGTNLLVLVLLAAAAAYWANRRKQELIEFFKLRGKHWLTAEAIFLAVFVLYMLTKLYNPDIHNPVGHGYNGGGEPMGMTFFSAAYKSLHFPPYDPWLSGYPINYYYYGQVMLGILAKLIGVPPAWSYNIVIALIFALTFTGVYGLGLALTGKRRWGVVAAVAALVMGNMHSFFYLLEPFTRGMNWSDVFGSLGRWTRDFLFHMGRFEFIWNPTRLIKGTINEMPWFSFLYGDLHAHIIAMPYSLPLIAWGLNLLTPADERHTFFPEASGRSPQERGLAFFVTALTLGALSAINTWNFPPYALLVLGVLLIHAFGERRGREIPWPAIGRAGLAWLRLVVGGLLLMFFFHKHFIPQSTSLAWVNPEVRTRTKEFLEFFGLAVFSLTTLWALLLVPQLRSLLSKLGWKPKRRSQTLWEQLQLVARNLFARHPLAVYSLIGLAAFLLVLALFDQTLLGILGLLLGLSAYALIWQPLAPQLRTAMLLAFLGLGIVFGCEIVHIRDFMGVGGDMSRMNTVFKFYMIVWIYFALAATASLAHIFMEKKETVKAWLSLLGTDTLRQTALWTVGLLLAWAMAYYFQETTGTPWLSWTLGLTLLGMPWVLAWGLKELPVRQGWAAVLAAMVFCGALYAPISLYNRMRLCSGFKHPTLKGDAYLDRMRPAEAKALAWINGNIHRTEIILEAPGKQGYNCFDTRVAVFTGHPTLIGWVGQEEQMRYNPELTGSHTRDADVIFGTPDVAAARALMDRYRVTYVFVGENERKAYPATGLAKFALFMDPVYSQEGVTIYKKR